MRIENEKYINLEIERVLNYYIIVDFRDKENILNNLLEDNFKESIEIDIYNKFIEYLEKEYKNKIDNINNFKEDIILYELDNILFELIESIIY